MRAEWAGWMKERGMWVEERERGRKRKKDRITADTSLVLEKFGRT